MERSINIMFEGKSYKIQQTFIDGFTWQTDEANGQRIEKVLPNLPKNMAKQLARFIRLSPLHDDTPEYIKEEETEDYLLELVCAHEYMMSVDRQQRNPNTGYYFMGSRLAFFAKENNYRMSFSSYSF